MPEGHTIHRIAIDHSKILRGKHVAVSSPQGRFAADAALVDGVTLERLEAYGKHLFYYWANGLVGHVHLGLFGRFRVYRGDGPHRRADGANAPDGRRRRRSISSGRPTCSIGTAEDPRLHRRPARPRSAATRCGPDRRHTSRSSAALAPIGQLLLDQKVISGLGNVYRAEALFLNGINPNAARQQDQPAPTFDGLWATIVQMLERGVDEDRIVTLDREEFDVPDRSRPTRRHDLRVPPRPLPALRLADPDRRARRSGLLLLPRRPA